MAWTFEEFVAAASGAGSLEPPVLDSAAGPVVRRDGREVVNLAGTIFLNREAAPWVHDEFGAAAKRYGLAGGGSRMTQGITRPLVELERDLCRDTGRERALTFASGLLANVGFVTAMSGRMRLHHTVQIDLGDVVFLLDRQSHWSLWRAAAHLRYGERLFAFRHNDPAVLDRLLTRLAGRRCVVMAESVYSADGSVAPLGDLLDVCERHDALSYVDDANGYLVYGPAHRPFAAELTRHPQIVDDYLATVEVWRQRLREAGASLTDSASYILSVRIGSDLTAHTLRAEFLRRGYQVPLFAYPAVPRDQAILRLLPSAGHTAEHLDGFLDTLTDLGRHHDFLVPGS